jgi:ribosome-associated protein
LSGRAERRAAAELVDTRPVSASLLRLILSALEDAKAEDVVAIDVSEKTSIGDHMVIASGRSQRHVGAVADQLQKALKAAGCFGVRTEGMPQCDWVLVDAGNVIVHIFQPETREFYNLEKMWQADRPLDVVPS